MSIPRRHRKFWFNLKKESTTTESLLTTCTRGSNEWKLTNLSINVTIIVRNLLVLDFTSYHCCRHFKNCMLWSVLILIYKREIRSILNLSMSLRVTEWVMIYVTSPAQLTYPVQQEDPGYERIEMATENCVGRFPFSQNFRNSWFGGKWNTFRRLVPLENCQKKWKI